MIQPIIGGGLIGLAAVLLLLVEGRIAGVSGMLSQSLPPTRWSALAFVVGLIVSGFFFGRVQGLGSFWLLGIAGVLVGVGTTLANGCTSGHGVCGVARLSKRSIVATMTFMAFAVVTRLAWGS